MKLEIKNELLALEILNPLSENYLGENYEE
jgi:hypothetical protein